MATAWFTAAGDLILLGFLRVARFLSPWSRTLVVDAGGKGDYDTINAAYAFIADTGASGGASSMLRWRVDVLPGIYPEVLDALSYVRLRGAGSTLTSITGAGTHILRGRADVDCFNFNLTGTGVKAGVRFVADVAGGVPSLTNCHVSVDVNTDDVVTAVEVTGTAGAYCKVQECYLYADNDNAGGSAKCVVVRTVAGCTVPIEGYNNQHKTSGTGGAPGVLYWNQGSVANAYGQLSGTWMALRSATAVDLINENSARPEGGFLDVAVHADVATKVVTTNPHAPAANRTHMIQKLSRLDVDGHLNARGTWDYPFTFGNTQLWYTAAGSMSFKPVADGVPSSDADGWPFQTATAKRTTAAVALSASTSIALPDLTLAVKPGQTYEMTYTIPVQVSAGTAGVLPVLAAPAGTTGWFQFQGTSSAATTVANSALSTNIAAGTVGSAYVTASFLGWVTVRTVLTITTAGNVTIALTTGASAAGSVLANSSLRAIRVG